MTRSQTATGRVSRFELTEREAMIARYAPTAEVMLAVLAGLTERYGGVEPYLLEAGVSRADLERLRERMLAPPAGEQASG